MIKQLSETIKNQPYPLLFVTISGAHLYGFPSADSDYDLRGVHILPAVEVVGLYKSHETIELSETKEGIEVDLVTHDIKKFFTLLLTRNGYVLEQLYSPLILQTTAAHAELKVIAHDCLTSYHSYHYLGFAKTQWRLFEKKQPRQVKPLLYVYRVLLTGIHLMQTGKVEANLLTLNEVFQLSYLQELIEQKVEGQEKAFLKETDLTFYRKEYERLESALKEATEKSHLPEKATAKEALNDLLLRLRLS
ncbi:MAG: nucleotidyltransferase domain-containing protein [Spirulinaceae cyanobacterium]